MCKVLKRDKSIVDFDESKIVKAIYKAMKSSGELHRPIADEIAKDIHSEVAPIPDTDPVDIKMIENKVYDKLVDKGLKYTAKLYEDYRSIREFKRNTKNSIDDSVKELLNYAESNGKSFSEVAVDNSNKDTRKINTVRERIAGEVSKDYALRMLLPTRVAEAHINCMIHYHDLDYEMQKGMFNCCLIDIGDMLDHGTRINGVTIETPKSFQTACNLTSQIIACVASSQYGGSSVDVKHLAKYLRYSYNKVYKRMKDELGYSDEDAAKIAKNANYHELQSGIQTLNFQINTLFTQNGQSPFITLFLNTDKNDPYADELVAIIEEILKQRIKGFLSEDGKSWITPTFPKLIYVLNEDNNLTGGQYDWLTELAVECTAKRMYPDYISSKMMKDHYAGNVFSPMGCRSFLSPSEYKNPDGSTTKFEGRFNQGVVTINLPQIGIISGQDEDKFWEILNSRLDICFEALMYRHNRFHGVKSDVSPIHWQDGAIARLKSGESIDKYVDTYYSTISLGYIGLYELTKLVKGVSHTDPEVGTPFALKVMKYLRATVDRWKKETGVGFALYGTPAENLCYRFAKHDREEFGIIKDVTDKSWYTNSYHVDVREHIDAFKKLEFEEQFQKISSGGCISYVEMPTVLKNTEALKSIIRWAYDHIQYFEFNNKSDYCQECGYVGEMIINDHGKFECPQCHNDDINKMYVVRRTCGYLGSQNWNAGKMNEFDNRYVHIGNDEL